MTVLVDPFTTPRPVIFDIYPAGIEFIESEVKDPEKRVVDLLVFAVLSSQMDLSEKLGPIGPAIDGGRPIVSSSGEFPYFYIVEPSDELDIEFFRKYPNLIHSSASLNQTVIGAETALATSDDNDLVPRRLFIPRSLSDIDSRNILSEDDTTLIERYIAGLAVAASQEDCEFSMRIYLRAVSMLQNTSRVLEHYNPELWSRFSIVAREAVRHLSSPAALAKFLEQMGAKRESVA